MPWVDPQHWSEWLSKGMRQGAGEIRRRLEELERRLEDLERQLEEERMLREQGAKKT